MSLKHQERENERKMQDGKETQRVKRQITYGNGTVYDGEVIAKRGAAVPSSPSRMSEDETDDEEAEEGGKGRLKRRLGSDCDEEVGFIRDGEGTFVDSHGNRYHGEWHKDQAHGYGTKTFRRGGYHEGFYERGKRHGQGKYVWQNGDKYVGEWTRGKMDGNGTFTWFATNDTYQGEWSMGLLHGFGKKTLGGHGGDVYEGYWNKGNAQGWGKKVFAVAPNTKTTLAAAGDVHEGQYHNDKRQGFGTFQSVNGDKYVGQWHDGKMNGRGIKDMGDVYHGDWCNDKAQGVGHKKFLSCADMHYGHYEQDKRQGFGSYVWAQSGDRYDGNWSNGRMTGLGFKRMANGDVYDGEWQEDQAHGFGTKYFVNGDVHCGFYKQDLREGYGSYTWVNGDVYEGDWHNGQQSGLGSYTYVSNGDVFEGRWEHGRKHGPGYLFTVTPPRTDVLQGSDVTGGAEARSDAPGTGVDARLERTTAQGASANDASASTSTTEAITMSSTATSATCESVFFEVWSRGHRLHREDVTKREKLPTIQELCQPQEKFKKRPGKISNKLAKAKTDPAEKQDGESDTKCPPSDGDTKWPPSDGDTKWPPSKGEGANEATETNESNSAFADEWRWVWEQEYPSSAAAFWGRRAALVFQEERILNGMQQRRRRQRRRRRNPGEAVENDDDDEEDDEWSLEDFFEEPPRAEQPSILAAALNMEQAFHEMERSLVELQTVFAPSSPTLLTANLSSRSRSVLSGASASDIRNAGAGKGASPLVPSAATAVPPASLAAGTESEKTAPTLSAATTEGLSDDGKGEKKGSDCDESLASPEKEVASSGTRFKTTGEDDDYDTMTSTPASLSFASVFKSRGLADDESDTTASREAAKMSRRGVLRSSSDKARLGNKRQRRNSSASP